MLALTVYNNAVGAKKFVFKPKITTNMKTLFKTLQRFFKKSSGETAKASIQLPPIKVATYSYCMTEEEQQNYLNELLEVQEVLLY